MDFLVWILLFMAPIFLLAGLAYLPGTLTGYLRARRLVAAEPTADLAASKPAVVEGIITPGPSGAVSAMISGEACVWNQVSVKETRAVAGKAKTMTIFHETMHEPFWLATADGQGIRVEMLAAKDVYAAASIRCSGNNVPTEFVNQLVAAGAAATGRDHLSCTESYLRVGDKVRIAGTATNEFASTTLMIDAHTVIASDQSPWRAAGTSRLLAEVAVVVAAAGGTLYAVFRLFL